jgi:hypothetical protein
LVALEDRLPSAEDIRSLSLESLERLAASLSAAPDRQVDPIRTVHHFACTGGTLISKGLQAQPNTLLLSEVDPLSTIQLEHQRSKFAPTDPILLARGALNPIDDQTATEMFVAAIKVLHARLKGAGRTLVLRDHAHSQFCTAVDWTQRPTLKETVEAFGPVLSILTVRHPIDSYLALENNNWRHFSPFSLEEYAVRYQAFLTLHKGVPIFRYEEFVEDPDRVMRQMCQALKMTCNPDWKLLISAMKLSGDSGRRGNKIAARTRRQFSDALVNEAEASPSYKDLCSALGYDSTLLKD